MLKIARIVISLSLFSIFLFSISTYAQAVNFYHVNDLIAGNPHGKVTVVEFFDFQCPHCITMAPILEAITEANPEVRIIYKQFPVRGPESEIAARAVFAANMQGK